MMKGLNACQRRVGYGRDEMPTETACFKSPEADSWKVKKEGIFKWIGNETGIFCTPLSFRCLG